MGSTIQSVFVALLVLAGFVGVGLGVAQQGTPTPGGDSAGDGTPVTAPNTQTKGPFTLTVEDVSICGLTCREVTVSLSNARNDSLSNITVESEILANDEVIVQRQMELDSLRPNESVTRTVQVNVGFDALQEIRQGDGMITIQTQVTSNDHSETFVANRTVV